MSPRFVLFVLVYTALTLPAWGQPARYKTTVQPLPSEDIAQPCQYELTIPEGLRSIRAVWVIFDRGRELAALYRDTEVLAFARRENLALLLPRHCRSKGYEDMNVEPAKGIGRALLTALEQFGRTTGHAELATGKLILLSFSGGGSLVARMAGYAPERVLAVIPYAPGHFEPLGMDTIELPKTALAIPQLIIANGGDKICGTDRPYQYFRKHYEQGAPWAFVIQNNIPHCCMGNAQPLILTWLAAVLKLKRHTIAPQTGWQAFFQPVDTEVRDEWKQKTWNMREATVQSFKRNQPAELLPAGWLPTKQVADAWLKFAQAPHRIISQP